MIKYIKKKYRKYLGIELEFIIGDENNNYVFVEELLDSLNSNKELIGEFEMEAFRYFFSALMLLLLLFEEEDYNIAPAFEQPEAEALPAPSQS